MTKGLFHQYYMLVTLQNTKYYVLMNVGNVHFELYLLHIELASFRLQTNAPHKAISCMNLCLKIIIKRINNNSINNNNNAAVVDFFYMPRFKMLHIQIYITKHIYYICLHLSYIDASLFTSIYFMYCMYL